MTLVVVLVDKLPSQWLILNWLCESRLTLYLFLLWKHMLTMHVAYREVSYIISPLADFFLIAHDVQTAAVAVQMTMSS